MKIGSLKGKMMNTNTTKGILKMARKEAYFSDKAILINGQQRNRVLDSDGHPIGCPIE